MRSADRDNLPADSEIIRLFRARDEHALACVRQKYGALISNLAFNVLRNKLYSEECVNDVRLKLWESFPPQGDVCIGAFAAALTRRTAIDYFRRGTRKSAVPEKLTLPVDELYDELSTPGAEDEFFARELGKLISEYLLSVSAKKRRVFVMRYYGCYTAAEIANKLGVSVSAVDKSLAKTKTELRSYLERNGFRL